jgi:hypothetical protein
MTYLNDEIYQEIKANAKVIAKKYGLKMTVSRERGMTDSVYFNIKSGSINFIQNYNETVSQQPGGFRNGSPAEDYLDVNVYWFKEHFTGRALDCMTELMQVLNNKNHNRSDSHSDYFDRGWYSYIRVGKWSAPYQLAA